LVNNGGVDDQDTLNLLVDGAYHRRPVPNRAIIDYQHNMTLANAVSAVPAGADVQAGFLIDPRKFTSIPRDSPQRNVFGKSSNRWYHPAGTGQ
jgi:hypothetical protein